MCHGGLETATYLFFALEELSWSPLALTSGNENLAELLRFNELP